MNPVILFLLFLTVPTYSRELIRTVTIDFLNITYSNPEYIIAKIEMKKLDRRTFSMNLSADVVRDITDMKGTMSVFKFSNNVYKETALKYSGDLCMLLVLFREKYKIHKNEQLKHLSTKCPIKKGHYYLHNFNGKDFGVPIIPLWKTRTFIEIETNNVLIGSAYTDATVIEATYYMRNFSFNDLPSLTFPTRKIKREIWVETDNKIIEKAHTIIDIVEV